MARGNPSGRSGRPGRLTRGNPSGKRIDVYHQQEHEALERAIDRAVAAPGAGGENLALVVDGRRLITGLRPPGLGRDHKLVGLGPIRVETDGIDITINDIGEVDRKQIEGHTFVVAASNSKDPSRADYVCTGTNDATVINTALRALPDGRGRVALLEGDYSIGGGSGTLNGANTSGANARICLYGVGQHLVGQGKGTRIFAAASLPAGGIVNLSDPLVSQFSSDNMVSDLLIDANGVSNLNAVFCVATSQGGGHYFRNVWMAGAHERIVFAFETNSCTFYDCEFSGNGIDNFGGSEWMIDHCRFDNAACGCRVSAPYFTVTNCLFVGTASGAYLGGDLGKVQNCFFIGSAGNQTLLGGTVCGLAVTSSANLISDNYFYGITAAMPIFMGAVLGNEVADNRFIGCNTVFSALSWGQIRVHVGNGQDGSRNVIRGNTFRSDSSTADYAIVLASPGSGTLDGTILDDNLFVGIGTEGPVGGSIVDQGTNTIYLGQSLLPGGTAYFGKKGTSLAPLGGIRLTKTAAATYASAATDDAVWYTGIAGSAITLPRASAFGKSSFKGKDAGGNSSGANVVLATALSDTIETHDHSLTLQSDFGAAELVSDGVSKWAVQNVYGTVALSTSGSTFTPTTISGCTLWLDGTDISTLWQDAARTVPVAADTDPVWVIDNKGSSGHNGIATGAGTRPLYRTNRVNGLSALLFDGSNDEMTFITTTYKTLFIVFNDTDGATFTADRYPFAYFDGGTRNVIAGSNGTANVSHGGTDDGTGYLNGTLFTSTAVTLSDFRQVSYLLTTQRTLGGYVSWALGGSHLGNIAAVVGYSGALSDADRWSVESYLRDRFALP